MITPLELVNSGCASTMVMLDEAFKALDEEGNRLQRGEMHPKMNQIAPNVIYTDEHLVKMRLKKTVIPVGSIVAKNGELPPINIPKKPITLELLNNSKIGVGCNFTEECICEMEMYQMYLDKVSANMGLSDEAATEMMMAYAARPVDLVTSCIGIGGVLMSEILAYGKTKYVDHRTNIQTGQITDFDFTEEIANEDPDAYMSDLRGNRKWSDAANSTPVTDLATHLRKKLDRFGRLPAGMQISRKALNAALNSAEAKRLVAEMQGVTDPTTRTIPVSCDEFMDVLGRVMGSDCSGLIGNFEVLINDTCYVFENAEGLPEEARYHPEKSYSFFDYGIFERAWWRSPAARYVGKSGGDLVYNQLLQGAFTAIGRVLNYDPVQEALTVSACFMPIISNVEMMGGRQVL